MTSVYRRVVGVAALIALLLSIVGLLGSCSLFGRSYGGKMADCTLGARAEDGTEVAGARVYVLTPESWADIDGRTWFLRLDEADGMAAGNSAAMRAELVEQLRPFARPEGRTPLELRLKAQETYYVAARELDGVVSFGWERFTPGRTKRVDVELR